MLRGEATAPPAAMHLLASTLKSEHVELRVRRRCSRSMYKSAHSASQTQRNADALRRGGFSSAGVILQLSRDGGKRARMTAPMGHMEHNNDKDRKIREGERIVVCAEVMLRRTGQNNYRVNAYDISRHGCRVEFVERPHVDECVWVKFDGIDAVEASVRWTRDFAAGLRFQHPIHPAVFDLLVNRLGQGNG